MAANKQMSGLAMILLAVHTIVVYLSLAVIEFDRLPEIDFSTASVCCTMIHYHMTLCFKRYTKYENTTTYGTVNPSKAGLS